MGRYVPSVGGAIVLLAWAAAGAAQSRDPERRPAGDEPRDQPAAADEAVAVPETVEPPGAPQASPVADTAPLPDPGLPPSAPFEDWVAAIAAADGEPTFDEAAAAAVARAGLDPGAEEDLVDEARWAALLPRLRVTVQRDWERDEALDLHPESEDDQFGVDTDDDLEVGVSAQWDLGDLVAPPVAVAARRLALEAEASRRLLRLQVAELYFERLRLRLEWRAAGSAAAGRRAAIAFAFAERTARLDALTGGLFRRALERGAAARDDRWSSEGTDGTR
jgi:hypothetical protein